MLRLDMYYLLVRINFSHLAMQLSAVTRILTIWWPNMLGFRLVLIGLRGLNTSDVKFSGGAFLYGAHSAFNTIPILWTQLVLDIVRCLVPWKQWLSTRPLESWAGANRFLSMLIIMASDNRLTWNNPCIAYSKLRLQYSQLMCHCFPGMKVDHLRCLMIHLFGLKHRVPWHKTIPFPALELYVVP